MLVHRHSPHYVTLLRRHRTHYVRLYTAKPSVGEGRQPPHCYSPRYVTRYTDTVLVTSGFTPTRSPLRHALHRQSPHYVMLYTDTVPITSCFTPTQSPLRHALHTAMPSDAEGRLPPHCISLRYVTRYTDTSPHYVRLDTAKPSVGEGRLYRLAATTLHHHHRQAARLLLLLR